MLPTNLGNLGKLNNKDKNASRKALGKGLGALIPGKSTAKARFFECPIERISPTEGQPRRVFDQDAINELSVSIVENGLIQPLVVRQDGGDFRLIAGERRLRAATLAGLDTVPVVIKDVNDDEAFELALIENIQREDLNPLEEAEAYERLMQARDYTQEQLAKRLGRSRSAIANTIRLLKLDRAVWPIVESGELAEGAARALLGLPTIDDQLPLAERAVQKQLSVRNVEATVKLVKDGLALDDAVEAVTRVDDPKQQTPEPPLPLETQPEEPQPTDDEEPHDEGTFTFAQRKKKKKWTGDLQARFGAEVKLKVRGKKGSIQLFFADRDELETLLKQLIGDKGA